MGDNRQKVVELHVNTALAIRLLMLESHYRKPLDYSDEKLKSARKRLRRIAMACEPSLDHPPVDVIEAVSDDLNTPRALALVAKYKARGDGRAVFAAMRFLGFWDTPKTLAEIKTLPPGHLESLRQPNELGRRL